MRNLKLTFSYDGTRYQGFTKPQNKERTSSNTICARLTETWKRLTGEEITLFCGEKTETGVHALMQTVNFKTDCLLFADELRRSLNHYLPQDICIFTVEEEQERFHAALNARAKTYEYRIQNVPVADVFSRKYALHLAPPLTIPAMEEAARLLTGRKDFQNFSAGKSKKKKNTEKELYSIQILALGYPGEVRILLTANDFLYQMPQFLIGTLLDVGLEKRSPDCIERILTGQENASAPCPAHGLYLKEILYNNTPAR